MCHHHLPSVNACKTVLAFRIGFHLGSLYLYVYWTSTQYLWKNSLRAFLDYFCFIHCSLWPTDWTVCIILIKDDELPDYIMVMLANKRSKEQMTEDLVLFLGTNTSLFTEWWVNSLGNCFSDKNGHDVIGETKFIFDKREKHKF